MNEDGEAGGDMDPAAEEDDLDDAGEMETDAESENDDDDEEQLHRRRCDDNDPAPARRKFPVEYFTSNPDFMSWYVERYPGRPTITQELVRKWRRDLEGRLKKRIAENEYIGRRVSHPKFKAWFSEQHPEIDWDTAIIEDLFTREIADEFDVFIGQPAIDDFCEIAFGESIDAEWPQEFRRWAKEEHRVREPREVTSEIIDDWNRYNDVRKRAHRAKGEVDLYYMMAEGEWEAGADQCQREGHRDLQFIPNTKVEWAALLQRRADRIAREKAETERKAAKERAETAEHQRKQTRIQKLKEYKLPAIKGAVPNVIPIGDAREKHDQARTPTVESLARAIQ